MYDFYIMKMPEIMMITYEKTLTKSKDMVLKLGKTE